MHRYVVAVLGTLRAAHKMMVALADKFVKIAPNWYYTGMLNRLWCILPVSFTILLYFVVARTQKDVKYVPLINRPAPSVPVWNPPHRTTCSKIVSVGIVDTGIDYTHNDLIPYIDDRVGVNYVDPKILPFDRYGHGTHIAGLIVAQWTSGKRKGCLRLYSLQYYDRISGYANLWRSTMAIEGATSLGLDLVNFSGGGLDPSTSEKSAVEKLVNSGRLLVSAAGNDGREVPYYPAAYNLEGQVTVASTDRQHQLLPSSNRGKWFEFATVGLRLKSTVPSDRYETMSGTSQATAIVTGLLATILDADDGPVEGRQKRALEQLRQRCKPLAGVNCGFVEPLAAP